MPGQQSTPDRDALTTGSDPRDVITGGEAGEPLEFPTTPGTDRDLHDRTEVVFRNPTAETVTDTMAVSVYPLHSDAPIARESRLVTVGAGLTLALDFLSDLFTLDDVAYRIEVTPAPIHSHATDGERETPIVVERINEHTRGTAFQWEKAPGGEYRLLDQHGRPRAEATAKGEGLRVPSGLTDQRGTTIREFAGPGLRVSNGTLQAAQRVTSTTATVSGTGTQTTFSLPHSLGETPEAAHVTPRSSAAAGSFYRSGLTASNVEITYTTAPPSGTNNLVFDLTVIARRQTGFGSDFGSDFGFGGGN